MREVKSFCSYEDQIEKLREKGCKIENEAECRSALVNAGYYRIKAYCLPFKKTEGGYIDGFEFSKVFRYYEFDEKLRSLLFRVIAAIEVSLRARLAYYHSKKYGPLGYLNAETFNSKHDHNSLKGRLDKEIENNKKLPFVKHHIMEYDNKFPLWVAVELFSFGMVLCFYNDLLTTDKKAFAGKDYKNMASWLRCCSDLRNICAHHGRIYYRIFPAIPAGLALEEQSKRRFWGGLMALKALFPFPDKWKSEFAPQLMSLMEEFKEDVVLSHLGFPDGWQNQLIEE